jgi:hypothetical protein
LWYRYRIVEKHRRMNQMQKTHPAGQRRSPESMRRRAGNIRIYRNAKMTFFSIRTVMAARGNIKLSLFQVV